ncbi:MAG: hypothetical protein Q7J98_11440 [Kiritimatiellia bacterium]|nr:hypothetical protein [Kiritimatiellia bacterium]
MKTLNLTLALFFVTGLACFALNTDTDKFFKTGPNPAKGLPADQVYPRGQLFPFTFYSVGGGSEKKRGELLPVEERIADQKQIINAGVTMIGPQYELNDQVVSDAKKYKVKAVYSIEAQIDGQNANTHTYLEKLEKEGKELDVEKLRKSVIEIVKRESVNPEIAWWSIGEEMRYWRKQDLLCLKTVSEAVKETDPQKRPVYMYEPGHRDAKELSKTVPFQNVSGKGMYVNYSGKKDSRVFCRWTIEQEIEGIKLSGNKDAIPIAVPEMFEQPAESDLPMVEAWVRHDVYSSLIAGAKGVAVFSASKRPNFKAREQYLKAYLQVCRELTGPLKLGQVFLFGERKDDISLTVTEGPKTVELKVGKETLTYPSAAIANIAHENCRYVFVSNSSGKPLNVVIDGLVYGKGVTIQNRFDPKEEFTAPEGNFNIDLKPWEVKVCKIYLDEK